MNRPDSGAVHAGHTRHVENHQPLLRRHEAIHQRHNRLAIGAHHHLAGQLHHHRPGGRLSMRDFQHERFSVVCLPIVRQRPPFLPFPLCRSVRSATSWVAAQRRQLLTHGASRGNGRPHHNSPVGAERRNTPALSTSSATLVFSWTLTSIVDPTNVPETLPELITLSPVVIVATCQGESPSRFFVKGDLRSDLVTDRIRSGR